MDNELESLARELRRIHEDAMGYLENDYSWDNESVNCKEAWRKVARFVQEQCNSADEPSDLDRDAMKREMMDELRLRVSWDQDRFKRNNYYDPDHK